MATVNVNSDWVIDGTLTSKALKVTGLGTALPTATWSEDFSVSLGDFTTSGNVVWTRVTDEGNGDLFSARSGAIADKQASVLQVIKTTTQYSTYLQYDYKTSTEGGYDYLSVYVDDVIHKQYSGTNAWTTDGFFIYGIGSKTIKFVYSKDNNTTGGTDQVWIDNVGLYNYESDIQFDVPSVFKDDVVVKGSLSAVGNLYTGDSYFTNRLQGYNKTTGVRTFNVSATSGAIQQYISTGQIFNSQSASLTQLDFTLYRPDTQAEVFKYGWSSALYTGGYFQMLNSAAKFAIGQAVTGTTEMMTINGTSLFKDEIGIGARVDGDAMVYVENPATTAKYTFMGKTTGVNNWSGMYHNSDNRFSFNLRNAAGTQTVLIDSNGSSYFNGGDLTIGTIAALGSTATTFLTHTAGLIQSRTAAQVLSDIGAAASSSILNWLRADISDIFAGTELTFDSGGLLDLAITTANGFEIKPGVASGGWARGLVVEKQSDGLRIGGAGFLGSAETISNYYIGFQADWWSGSQFTFSSTGNLTATGSVQGTRLISTIAIGTSPLSVTSTTVNTNLNADLLDGQHGSYYQNASNLNAGIIPVARLKASYLSNAPYESFVQHNRFSSSPPDFDTILQSGIYGQYNTGTTNAPSNGSSYDPILVLRNPTDVGVQVVFPRTGATSTIAFRGWSTSGTLWTNWKYVWHDQNDGTGSGLDADLLDGIEGASYLRSDVADTKTSGNLTFNDNIAAVFGNSSAISLLYSNGTYSALQLNSGDFRIRDGGSTDRFTFGRTTGNLTATGTIKGTGFILDDGVDFATVINKSGVGGRVIFGDTTGYYTGVAIDAGGSNITFESDSTGLGAILSNGNTIFGRTTALAIEATATHFASTTPKFEIQTGTAAGTYQEAMVLRHQGHDATAVTRRLGFLMKLSSESGAGESDKMGGMMLESANTFANSPDLHFLTADTKRMTIFYNGNVSIGNTNNTYKLDVTGTGRFTDSLTLDNSSPQLQFYNGASNYGSVRGTSSGAVIYSADGTFGLRVYDVANYFNGIALFKDAADTVELMRLHDSGNLSIGNTTNTYKLDVSGTGRFTSTLQIDQKLAIGIATGADPHLHVYRNSAVTASGIARLEQVGTGDSSLEFVAGSTWAIGIDNSDDDDFKISTTPDLASGTKVIIDRITGALTAVDGTRKIITDDATTSHTIVPADHAVVRRFTSSSAITVTVNSGSLTNIGEVAEIDQYGTGTVTIAAGTATLRVNSNKTLVADGQYSRIAIQKMTSTEYRVFGELA